jgi:hypothetical protein
VCCSQRDDEKATDRLFAPPEMALNSGHATPKVRYQPGLNKRALVLQTFHDACPKVSETPRRAVFFAFLIHMKLRHGGDYHSENSSSSK